ncbi:MAG TPA: DNA-binding protein [archaeon]|nr:DNA-binding protein [archaeon]
MKISELKSGMNNVSLRAKVASMSEPKQIQTKFGTQTTLVNAVLQDDSGSMPIALWGQQSEGIQEGVEVELTNGFTKEFKGEVQLGVGKTGKIAVV